MYNQSTKIVQSFLKLVKNSNVDKHDFYMQVYQFCINQKTPALQAPVR